VSLGGVFETPVATDFGRKSVESLHANGQPEPAPGTYIFRGITCSY
jgi:hypothetical protein